MSESESDSELCINEEDDEKDDVGDDGPPSWMIGSTPAASSTSATAPTETEAKTSASTNTKSNLREDMNLDNLFGAFMNEVNGVKSAKRQKLETQMKIGSPEEMVERLMSKEWRSAYEVLMVSPESTEGEITKMYRKISMMVHPDKCKHEQANDAFQKVNKAYMDLKDPLYKDKYVDVIAQAKKLVTEAREKENVEREKKGEELLPMDGPDFDQAVVGQCEDMLNVTEKEATYADKVREKNEARIAQLQGERKKRDKKESTDKRKWETNRDKRVAGWQIFQQNVSTKKFKNLSSGQIGRVGAADQYHARQERTELEEEQKKKYNKEDLEGRPAGIDHSFKKVWR